MAITTGRTIEVDSLEDFDALVARGARRMSGWRLQDLDLRERTEALLSMRPSGALLLGCDLTDRAATWLLRGGALLFPSIPELPFEPYRNQLYTPAELYAGLVSGYQQTLDARIYAWSRQQARSSERTLSRALHDNAIDESLEELLAGRHVVGVMGGHAVRRGDPDYRAAALLGRELTRSDAFVVTGGGPGAMEAANLGAYLAGATDTALEQALGLLAATPDFRPSIAAWATVAFDVRQRWPDGSDSLGIPTWFYGHEPPNPFATSIAKYFQNALREDTLLHRCQGGIVFLPGAAGTVQEIFQDACENYYADDATVAPMVLVGERHWVDEVPAWPLLEQLAAGRSMSEHVHLVSSHEDAVALLT